MAAKPVEFGPYAWEIILAHAVINVATSPVGAGAVNAHVSGPAVSVIVPTHQRRELVRRAVASVLTQTFQDFELIVVDDGSTDGTREAMAELGDRIRYMWQENTGQAAARNAGLELARGSIVAFLDDDNRWLPDHLAGLIRALGEHPEAVLAYTQSTLQPRPRPRSRTARLRNPLPSMLVGNYVGVTSGVAVRREAVAAVGGFDERLRLAEDADLWLRLAVRGAGFVSLSQRSVVKRETKGSLLASRRRGECVDALELSTERTIGELDRAGGDQASAWAQGRRHLFRALRALSERDEEAVRARLADACRLLPELSEAPNAIFNYVRFNLPATGDRAERARQLATVAGLWPDRASDVARVLPAYAFLDALAALRPAEAWRLSSHVSPRLVRPVLLRMLGLRARRLPGPRPENVVRSVHRVMLRTQRGPFRPAWWLAHEALARAVATYLRGGDPRTSAYVCGSLGDGDPVFGLSDIDLVVVVGDREDTAAACREVNRRWRRLRDRLPTICEHLFEPPRVYGEGELGAAVSQTTLTHGLRSRRLAPSSRERRREQGGAERPRLYGLTTDWRLVGGPDLRPPFRPKDADERRLSAWMELQFWWLQAFRGCVEPRAPWTSFLCAKLLTEPARIWLWLARGERIFEREALIERAMGEWPDEEEALRLALELLGSLSSSRVAPLDDTLRSLTRMSVRVATEVQAGLDGAGTTEVRLLREGSERLVVPPSSLAALRRAVGLDGPLDTLPLLDWRARVWSLPPDECLAPIPLHVPDPALLGAAALACNHGAYTALRRDGLLVVPSLKRARLRAVQCAASDPVSFALADGTDRAAFPNVPGWSARDSARRAVAEHLGWLRADERLDNGIEELGRLLTAARAALFLESIESGAPELALGVASVAYRLAERFPGDGSLALEAYESYQAGRLEGRAPPERLVPSFRNAVVELPCFRTEEGVADPLAPRRPTDARTRAPDPPR